MTQLLTRALLLSAALGSTLIVGCASDNERASSTRQPAAASHPAPAPAGQPAAAGQQTAGEAVDDAVVTAKVKARLVDDEVTKPYQINVETFKGTVQLSGSVASEEARSRATDLAKNVGGVKSVKNSLQVRKSDG